MNTIPNYFWERVNKTPDKIFLKIKRQGSYIDISYNKAGRVVSDIYYGLKALGIEIGDRIGIISENRPEWMYADLGILSAAAITVPLYESLSPLQVEYILEDTACRIVFVSNEIQLTKVLKVCDGLPALERIVVMDDVNPELKGKGILAFFELMRMGNDEEKGNRFALPNENPDVDPESIATIIYTSGTTGVPKGVALNHRNIISNIESALQILHVSEDDICLSFLPLSHIFERTDGYYLMIRAGVTIAFAENLESIPKNLIEIKPTVMISVPRFYEKMYNRVIEAVESGSVVKRLIFALSMKIGRRASKQLQNKKRISIWMRLPYYLADKACFSKLRERLGGRIRFFVSGGAPLDADVARFFHAGGLMILEGYGLTETSPVVTVNRLNSYRFGSIGKPLPNVEIKIADDGELCVRGPNVMLGYVNDQQRTNAAIDENRWFHTGDLGHIDEDGFVFITGRKKEILVLSTGKNVSPNLIEKELLQQRYVNQAMLVGDKRKFVSCLIVPDFAALEKFALSANIPYENPTELLRHSRIQGLFTRIVEEASKDFAKYEKIKKFSLIPREFDQSHGELTPTLKLRRDKILENFHAEIEQMYRETP